MALAAAVLLVGCSKCASESDIMAELNKLRGIQPTDDTQELGRINKQMDDVWKFLRNNKSNATPIIERELRRELTRDDKDQFFILDTAFFLILQDPSKEKLALDALEHINPDAEIIQYNFLQLARFTHALAKLGNPRLLPQIDRIFLVSKRSVEFFHAPHYVKLTPHLINVLLYGATGPSVEEHLAKRLHEEGYEAHRVNLLSLLIELGSERSVDAVKQVLNIYGDYETVRKAVVVLMRVGGPRGRDVVLTIEADSLDPKSREYLASILPAVKSTSYALIAQSFKSRYGGGRVFNDKELSKRLENMYKNFGVDNELSPNNLLISQIPKEDLLIQLKRIRSRMFFRFDQHGINDALITSEIINALQYKP